MTFTKKCDREPRCPTRSRLTEICFLAFTRRRSSPASEAAISTPCSVVTVVALGGWVRRPGQRARLDHLLLGLPMVGQVAKKFATSQMARTLATLLGGGLPLVNALDIAAKSIGNQFMAQQLEIVSARV